MTPFPGAIETKPGSATVPFFGVEPVILEPQSGKILEGNSVEGVLCIKNPWPSIARSVNQDHNRYLDTYMRVCIIHVSCDIVSNFWPFSHIPDSSTLVTVLPAMSTDTSGSRVVSMVSFSNGSHFAERGLSWTPDVINVSGHRLSTAEIESALILHKGVAETAVIGVTDEVTGQTVFAFVTLKPYALAPQLSGVGN